MLCVNRYSFQLSTTDRFVNERAPWFFFECVKIDILNTETDGNEELLQKCIARFFSKVRLCGELGWTKETKKRSKTKRTSWTRWLRVRGPVVCVVRVRVRAVHFGFWRAMHVLTRVWISSFKVNIYFRGFYLIDRLIVQSDQSETNGTRNEIKRD